MVQVIWSYVGWVQSALCDGVRYSLTWLQDHVHTRHGADDVQALRPKDVQERLEVGQCEWVQDERAGMQV